MSEELVTIPSQIRAGRAMVGLSQDELAEKAGVSLTTVRDYENERRGGEVGALRGIRRALENEGVVFVPGDEKLGPGVRLAGQVPNVLRRPARLGRWGELVVPVEWRGREYAVMISRDVMDDFGRFRETRPEADYLAVFDTRRAAILKAAAVAIDSGRAGADRGVSLGHDDFPEAEFR